MAAFCNLTIPKTTALAANGSAVSSLTIPSFYVINVDSVLFLSIVSSNTAGSAPAAPSSITDTFGLIWTKLTDFTYDGTNGTRNALYWARPFFRGLTSITVTFAASVSLASIAVIEVDGAHITSPQDLNANSLKTESHTASAASSISGFSTTSPDCIVLAFYGSRTTGTAPGTITGFTVALNGVTNMRHAIEFKTITSAESSATYAFPTSTATGSMIAVAIRIRDVSRRQIRFLQSFDFYNGISTTNLDGKISNTTVGENAWIIGTASQSLQTGRDGIGLCYRCAGSGTGIAREGLVSTSGFYVTNPNVLTATGGNAIGDGEHVYLGFNLKLGTTLGASVQDRNSVFGFGQSATTDRITFTFNKNTKVWGLILKPGTSGTTSPTTIADDVNATPSADPYQNWVWVELHLYRAASGGRIEMWQEVRSGGGGDPGSPFAGPPWLTGTVYIPNPQGTGPDTPGSQHWTMEKIFDYTGDTSVANLGTITQFVLIGDHQGTNKDFGSDIDDLVFSTGGVMGQPCYIRTFVPTSDVSVSGWSPSTGTDHFAVVDETVANSTDYLTASTGNPKDVFAFSGNMGYTPRLALAVDMIYEANMPSGTDSKQMRALLKSGSIEVPGFSQTVTGTTFLWPHVCSSQDPATRATWEYTAALAADMGIDVPTVNNAGTSQSFAAEHRVYCAYKMMLATIETGNGLGGTPDDPASPGIQDGGTPVLVGGIYNCAMHPIGSRGVQDYGLANLHPIDKGICQ